MLTNRNFWNLYPHFYTDDHPPVIVDKASGELVRHGGGSSRCAFWAGYDGVMRGPNVGPKGSVTNSAHRAGVAYRKAVDSGKRAALPANRGRLVTA